MGFGQEKIQIFLGLTIKKRKIDAGEPAKYLGCGICDNLSHSTTVAMATDDVDVLYRIASQLFGHFQIDVEDIRGMSLQENKSIGADVNWGVRFKDLKDAQHFLKKLCDEVSLRLKGCGVKGRTFTIKIKKRKIDAGEPAKYLGCGICDNLSHSTTVAMATDDVDVLYRIASQLFGHFQIAFMFATSLQENKSIGADVNWGVRFKDLKDAQHFLKKLCDEVSLRLEGCGVKGRTFTIKIKKRKIDAGSLQNIWVAESVLT
ncbi:unnamed protein product [Cuscuta campestris]|uniref:DNA repair protein REV1 n=1 Tax=Cuscuta campestris TaxID=132261 RepID=A0A484LWK8_9ASTE|nr:unnamed protein product [Cuscuta campestris]